MRTKYSGAAPTSRVKAGFHKRTCGSAIGRGAVECCCWETRVIERWDAPSFDPVESVSERLGLRISLRCACDPVPVVSALVQGGGRWAIVMHHTDVVPGHLAADGAEPWLESD
jgi:hypothetical protein